jgi:hypothetical protein
MQTRHKPLTSWWPSKIESDAHGKRDPVFDQDWSYRPTSRSHHRQIRERLPDPKLTRLKMQLALVLADNDRVAWKAKEDAMTPKEKEIRDLQHRLAELVRTRNRVCNP